MRRLCAAWARSPNSFSAPSPSPARPRPPATVPARLPRCRQPWLSDRLPTRQPPCTPAPSSCIRVQQLPGGLHRSCAAPRQRSWRWRRGACPRPLGAGSGGRCGGLLHARGVHTWRPHARRLHRPHRHHRPGATDLRRAGASGHGGVAHGCMELPAGQRAQRATASLAPQGSPTAAPAAALPQPSQCWQRTHHPSWLPILQVACQPARLVLRKSPGACVHAHQSASAWVGQECKHTGAAGFADRKLVGGGKRVVPLEKEGHGAPPGPARPPPPPVVPECQADDNCKTAACRCPAGAPLCSDSGACVAAESRPVVRWRQPGQVLSPNAAADCRWPAALPASSSSRCLRASPSPTCLSPSRRTGLLHSAVWRLHSGDFWPAAAAALHRGRAHRRIGAVGHTVRCPPIQEAAGWGLACG